MQNQKLKVRRLYVFISAKKGSVNAASETYTTAITVSRLSTCC